MAYKKIEKFIGRLNRRFFETYQSYLIWKFLYLARDKNTHGQSVAQKNVDIINSYINFFPQTERSNLVFFIIGVAKFFDVSKNHNKPLSIKKVQNCAQGDKRQITPENFRKANPTRPFVEELASSYEGITEDDLKRIDEIAQRNDSVIEKFKSLRDKWAAHEDAIEINVSLPPFEEIEKLFADIQEMLNILSEGLESTTTTYSHVAEMTKDDMDRVFKVLKNQS